MESLFGGELGLLGGGEGLKEDGCGGWRSPPSPDGMYSASHFTLITAYQDIKTRLAGLERENSGIKRKLKMYEIKVVCQGHCDKTQHQVRFRWNSLFPLSSFSIKVMVTQLAHFSEFTIDLFKILKPFNSHGNILKERWMY